MKTIFFTVTVKSRNRMSKKDRRAMFETIDNVGNSNNQSIHTIHILAKYG